MSDTKNSADGRTSFDTEVDGTLVSFLNRNVTPYPTEVGGPKFDLVPVTKQKDIMLNVARMHAQQEYERIMDLVKVLQSQAAKIKRRLEITDALHSAEYQFKLYNGNIYWLCYDNLKKFNRLVKHGPTEWFTGKPSEYDYICRVKWLGDYTWIEVDENGKPVD
jgi:hypothetical protein